METQTHTSHDLQKYKEMLDKQAVYYEQKMDGDTITVTVAAQTSPNARGYFGFFVQYTFSKLGDFLHLEIGE